MRKAEFRDVLYEIIYPLAVFMAVRLLVGMVLGQLLPDGANAAAISSSAGIFTAGLAITPTAKRIMMEKNNVPPDKRHVVQYIIYYVGIILLAYLFTYLLNFFGLTEQGDFANTGELQASASIPVSICCYGLLAPIGEELLFRACIFNSLQNYVKPVAAIIISSLLFGIYHGNMVQFIFGSIMGALIAGGYHYFKHFRVAVLAHVVINLSSILIFPLLINLSL